MCIRGCVFAAEACAVFACARTGTHHALERWTDGLYFGTHHALERWTDGLYFGTPQPVISATIISKTPPTHPCFFPAPPILGAWRGGARHCQRTIHPALKDAAKRGFAFSLRVIGKLWVRIFASCLR